MIRQCDETDFEAIYEIINDAAGAYKGLIPADVWSDPYMSEEELDYPSRHLTSCSLTRRESMSLVWTA